MITQRIKMPAKANEIGRRFHAMRFHVRKRQIEA